jgi:hypothetical protein
MASRSPDPVPVDDLPAGIDPYELAAAPAGGSGRRALRRRLRYLRRARELLLRDLGGFSYELHRTTHGFADEGRRRLIEAKAGRLTALDAELRRLEVELGEPRSETVLREPGIGGTCPFCGDVHASEASFCSQCGSPLTSKARARRTFNIAHMIRQSEGERGAELRPPP